MEHDMENDMETGIYRIVILLGSYRSYIGIMENKMEAAIVYWCSIGRMESWKLIFRV